MFVILFVKKFDFARTGVAVIQFSEVSKERLEIMRLTCKRFA